MEVEGLHPLAPIYVRLIRVGLRALEDVPDTGTLRGDVQKLLEEG